MRMHWGSRHTRGHEVSARHTGLCVYVCVCARVARRRLIHARGGAGGEAAIAITGESSGDGPACILKLEPARLKFFRWP